jgi:hypothetical protein
MCHRVGNRANAIFAHADAVPRSPAGSSLSFTCGFAGSVSFAIMLASKYNSFMRKLTIRLLDALLAEIEGESRRRKLSKSDVVRERLRVSTRGSRRSAVSLDTIVDLIGSVEGLPRDLSVRKKKYLGLTGYGRNASR